MEADTNEDGKIDIRYYYKNGRTFKIESGNGLFIEETKVDTDNDGILDQIIKYDYLFEEIK